MEQTDQDQITKKIDDLRNLHADWDPSALERISDFEKTIATLTIEQDYANLDITKRILNRCKIEIKHSILQLANQVPTKNPYEDARIRHGLIERKKVFQYFLGLFSKDYQKEMQAVESAIDFELSE